MKTELLILYSISANRSPYMLDILLHLHTFYLDGGIGPMLNVMSFSSCSR